MGLFQRFRKGSKSDDREAQRDQALDRFRRLVAALPPVNSLPDYPPFIEKPTYTIVFRQVVGSQDEVAKAIWERWCFHQSRTGPYGDPESAAALKTLEQMLDNQDGTCEFPWGVNKKEFRLHRASTGECMFVDILYQQR